MAIIYTYPEINQVEGEDLLLISDTSLYKRPTRSVTIDNLAAYIGTVTSGPSGSGTTNYTARWTNASTLGIGALYDNGTSVGIGINGTYANPPQRLTVVSDDSLQPVAYFRNIGTGGGLFVRTDGTTRPIFELFSGSSYRVVVTGAGNLGIGTTSPTTKVDVNGDIRIQGENELYLGGTGSVPYWEITASGSDLIVNDTGTNVGSVLFNNDEGVALPRLTTTEINAISSPTQGLMAYNTTLNTICFYNGSSWQKVSHTSM